jgi:hypothetical protein
MVVKHDKVVPEGSRRQPPIELLTENGFSIFRLSEIDESIPRLFPTHQFLVRDPNQYELQISVHIVESILGEIATRCRGRITSDSSYWTTLAEHHLSDYLWQNDDYPPDGTLVVSELTIDDIDLARRWNCEPKTKEKEI